jgi:hypothetical protein
MSVSPVNGNDGFSKIQDSILDLKVFEGLVAGGILPQGFRVIKASVDITGAAGNYAIVDESGNQIHLAAGTHIVYVSGGELTAVAGGTSAQVGLAATATGAVSTAISDVLTTALIGSDGIGLHVDATVPIGGGAVIVDATDNYLVATTLGTYTAGEIQLVMVVV